MYFALCFILGLFFGVGVMVNLFLRATSQMLQFKGVALANAMERQLWQAECIKYATILEAFRESSIVAGESATPAEVVDWPEELREAGEAQ